MEQNRNIEEKDNRKRKNTNKPEHNEKQYLFVNCNIQNYRMR